MQRYLLGLTAFFAVILVISMGSSNGPGEVQGQDRTGSPLANGFCQNCHSAGIFSPTISLTLTDVGGAEVTQYVPGEEYILEVNIAADASAAIYGFQTVSLSGEDDLRAGTFGEINGTQVINLNDRLYAEHSSPSDVPNWEVPWTAPDQDVGDIRFYAAGIAADDNGSTGGDGASRLPNPMVISPLTSSINAPVALAEAVSVFPNPVFEQTTLTASLEEATLADLNVYNSNGQRLETRRVELFAGDNQLTLDMTGFPAGHYQAELRSGNKLSTVTILKH